jgi:hypothetical protein
MAHVVGSQKFASLEIVDSAKFDNEIVFSDLSMMGGSLSIICDDDVTITSLGTSPPCGINLISVCDITSNSSNGTVSLIAGNNELDSPEDSTSGSVVIGNLTSSLTSSGTTKVIEATFDGYPTLVNRLGFFDVTPVEQPILSADDLPSLLIALRDLGLIA